MRLRHNLQNNFGFSGCEKIKYFWRASNNFRSNDFSLVESLSRFERIFLSLNNEKSRLREVTLLCASLRFGAINFGLGDSDVTQTLEKLFCFSFAPSAITILTNHISQEISSFCSFS